MNISYALCFYGADVQTYVQSIVQTLSCIMRNSVLMIILIKQSVDIQYTLIEESVIIYCECDMQSTAHMYIVSKY